MPRRIFYDRIGTLDAAREDEEEPTGLSRETVSNKGGGPGRLVAQLPGSAADYFIATSGDGSGRADLWEVDHARGGAGVNPLDQDAVRERLRAQDSRLDDPNTWRGEGEEAEHREELERRAGDAQRRLSVAARGVVDAATRGQQQGYGLAMGRLTRQRDTARLKAINLANRRGPTQAA